MLIAGDIGASTTRLALVSYDKGARAFVAEEEYRSRDFPGLQPVVEAFLGKTGAIVADASRGVAGTVLRGHARLMNLPWEVDARALGSALKLDRVFLLKDLEAIAHAIPSLGDVDVVTLNPGTTVDHAALAVLAPGPGFGNKTTMTTVSPARSGCSTAASRSWPTTTWSSRRPARRRQAGRSSVPNWSTSRHRSHPNFRRCRHC